MFLKRAFATAKAKPYGSAELGSAHSFLLTASKLFIAEIPTIANVENAMKNPPPLPVSQATMDLMPKRLKDDVATLLASIVVKKADAFPACAALLWLPIIQDYRGQEKMHRDILNWSYRAVWQRATVVHPADDDDDEDNTVAQANREGDKYTLAVKETKDTVVFHKGTESFFIVTNGEPSIDVALGKLAEKYAPNAMLIGDAPFLPVVVYDFPRVQFALLVPDSLTAFTTFKPVKVGKELDLKSQLDRVRLVTGMGVFYALWLKLIKLWPAERYGYNETLPGTTASVVRHQVDDSGRETILFEKKLPRKAVQRMNWDDVIALFSVAHEIPFLVRAHSPTKPSEGAESHVLRVYPIGNNRMPRNLIELKAMITCVLQCLQVMHLRKFVHRDVTPQNVVRLFDGTWWLIDLERARRCDAQTLEAPWPKHYSQEYMPDLDVDDKRWCPVHDVWQLAKSVSEIANEMEGDHTKQVAHELAETIWQACWDNPDEDFPMEKAPTGQGDANAAARALLAIETV